ncbi:MAG: MFS transporter [Thaumarchaeota archaeon]|nr:MFS transporter [Nitrososphaerota archaeon]
MTELRVRLHALLSSLANNLASPFVAFNVTSSGGSDLLIGYVQAISTLASSITQLIGGRIADRLSKRLALAMLFSGVMGTLWLLTSLVTATTVLAVAYTAITLSLGFYAAGWSSFLGEASEGGRRGAFLANFAQLGSYGALIALLITTAITAVNPSYAILDALAGVVFVVSALMLRGMKERPVVQRSLDGLGTARMRRYYAVTGFYGFFWGFGWPLFTITTVKIVNMSLFEYSVAQVIAVAATIGFQPLVGRLVDRDRRRWVFWGRMGLVAYPIAYMVIGASWEIYALNVFSGFTNALLNIAFAAYLFDISPVGRRGRYGAEFNLVTGVTTMTGSLFAAFLLTSVNSFLGLWESLAILYVVATGGRALAALFHLWLPTNIDPMPHGDKDFTPLKVV